MPAATAAQEPPDDSQRLGRGLNSELGHIGLPERYNPAARNRAPSVVSAGE
jgi:hypothetical protein